MGLHLSLLHRQEKLLYHKYLLYVLSCLNHLFQFLPISYVYSSTYIPKLHLLSAFLSILCLTVRAKSIKKMSRHTHNNSSLLLTLFLFAWVTPISFFTDRTAKFSPLIFFIRNYYELMTFTASKTTYFLPARLFFSLFLDFIINFAVMFFSALYTAINMIIACYFKNFMTYRTYLFHNDHCSTCSY